VSRSAAGGCRGSGGPQAVATCRRGAVGQDSLKALPPALVLRDEAADACLEEATEFVHVPRPGAELWQVRNVRRVTPSGIVIRLKTNASDELSLSKFLSQLSRPAVVPRSSSLKPPIARRTSFSVSLASHQISSSSSLEYLRWKCSVARFVNRRDPPARGTRPGRNPDSDSISTFGIGSALSVGPCHAGGCTRFDTGQAGRTSGRSGRRGTGAADAAARAPAPRCAAPRRDGPSPRPWVPRSSAVSRAPERAKAPAARARRCRRARLQRVNDLASQRLLVDAEVDQDSGGDARCLPGDSEENVLPADVDTECKRLAKR